ncbi:MAG: HTH domain-containing protein [Planctomycetota bacterium]
MSTRIERLLRLIQRLTDDVYPNADAIAADIGVSRRTVFRDLESLRAAGMSVRFDLPERGYRIEEEEWLGEVPGSRELLELLLRAHTTMLAGNAVQDQRYTRAIEALTSQLSDEELRRWRRSQSLYSPPSDASCTPKTRGMIERVEDAYVSQRSLRLCLNSETMSVTRLWDLIPTGLRYTGSGWVVEGRRFDTPIWARFAIRHVSAIITLGAVTANIDVGPVPDQFDIERL